MKSLLMLALVSLCGPAFAGNDGPSAMPKPQVRAVAEVMTYCGFMCPGGEQRGVRILSDGSVISVAQKRNSPETSEKIAQLEPAVAAKFVKQVEDLEITKLVDPDAGKGQCMDAPSTIYTVTKANGTKSQIAAWEGCHNFSMENGEGGEIKKLLEAFSGFSR